MITDISTKKKDYDTLMTLEYILQNIFFTLKINKLRKGYFLEIFQ